MYSKFIQAIDALKAKKQLYILGSAIIDLRMTIEQLPQSGQDVQLDYQQMHLGGCAFNILLALKRMDVNAYPALPIGNGIWAQQTEKLLKTHGITSSLYHKQFDNGWCMALVEPSGERTFLTVPGAETYWDKTLLQQIPLTANAIIYLSGYQLLDSSSSHFIQWLQNLTYPFKLVIDFGPRIEGLTLNLLQQLIAFKPIFTLNRQEAEHLAKLVGKWQLFKTDAALFAKYWQSNYQLPLLIRLDSEGCILQDNFTHLLSAFPVTVKDSIGAGDSHTAGLLAGLSANWDLKTATLLGNAIAAYVVGHEGGDCAPNKMQLTQWLLTHQTKDFNMH